LKKNGLDNFNFCIYEYFSYDSKIVSNKALTDLETSYIQKYDFDSLYNFMKTATSLFSFPSCFPFGFMATQISTINPSPYALALWFYPF